MFLEFGVWRAESLINWRPSSGMGKSDASRLKISPQHMLGS